MILITKDEAQAVRNKFKDVCITRTVKSKSHRHKYYCEERRKVIEFIESYRKNLAQSKGV